MQREKKLRKMRKRENKEEGIMKVVERRKEWRKEETED